MARHRSYTTGWNTIDFSDGKRGDVMLAAPDIDLKTSVDSKIIAVPLAPPLTAPSSAAATPPPGPVSAQ